MTLIKGNTYPVRDQLKAMGAKWSPDNRAWLISDSLSEQARKIVAGTPASEARATGMASDKQLAAIRKLLRRGSEDHPHGLR